MTYPEMDWPEHIDTESVTQGHTIWAVCYIGNSGKWIWTSPSIFKENAESIAQVFASSGREVRILEYELKEIHPVPFRVKKVKKIKKVRKVAD